MPLKKYARSKATKQGRAARRMKRLRAVTVARRVIPRALPVSQEAHVKQLLRSMTRAGRETKYVSFKDSPGVAHNSSIAGSDMHRIVPMVAPGTLSNQRVGDAISPTSCVVKIKVRLSDDQYAGLSKSGVPFEARILGLYQKDIKTWASISNFDYNHLLKPNQEGGSDIAQPYSGYADDNMIPVNRDKFRVWLDRKIQFKPQLTNMGQLPVDGTVQPALLPQEYTFTVRLKTPKTLYFDDGNGNQPNNWCPFLVAGFSFIPNVGPAISTYLNVSVQSYMYYKDA